MEIHKSSDSNALCRCCLHLLDPTKQFPDVFLIADLAKKLALVTSLTVEAQDRFPKHLCDSCFNNVNDFHQFQAMCVESVQRFSEMCKSKDLVASGLFEDEEQLEFELNGQMKIEIIEPEMAFESRESQEESENILLNPIESDRKCMRPKKAKTVGADIGCKMKAKLKIKTNTEIRKSRRSTLKQNKNESDVYHAVEAAGAEEVSEGNREEPADSDDEFLISTLKKEKCKTSSNKDSSSTTRKKRTFHKRNCESPSNAKSNFAMLQCDVCPSRFFAEHRLIAHKRIHEGLSPYPCPVVGCDKSYKRNSRLSEHVKHQHDGITESYKCEESCCDRSYTSKSTLAMHMRKYHKLGAELKTHICEVCGKVFKESAILKCHRYTHKDKSEQPFACEEPQCQRRFINKDKLKVHMMRHAGIKNFVCPYCGLRKTTRNELRSHINVHTLERRWPCRSCEYVCNSSGNLKRHVRTVHELAKDYACQYCERSFAKPDTRKYHEMTHTGEKPNECKECGKGFIQPVALRRHMKTHEAKAGIDPI